MFIKTNLDETQREFVTNLDFYRTDDQLDEDVTRLLEWMSKQPHLPEITDRKWLSHFIVGCKYNLHKAKQIIDSYFVTRAEHPEFIGSFDREWSQFNRKYGAICLLPKLTPEANRVLFTKMYPLEKGMKVDFSLFFRSKLAFLDLQLREEPMRGEIILYDLEHLPLGEFMNMSPMMLKNCINLCINAFPLSVKGIHFINSPSFIGQIINFVKMFLPEKLKKRLYVHDTLESLYQFISKDVLPDEYGGTGGNIEKIDDICFEYAMANNEWLGNRPKADLSKRVGQPKVGELGVEGTFKKLEID